MPQDVVMMMCIDLWTLELVAVMLQLCDSWHTAASYICSLICMLLQNLLADVQIYAVQVEVLPSAATEDIHVHWSWSMIKRLGWLPNLVAIV